MDGKWVEECRAQPGQGWARPGVKELSPKVQQCAPRTRMCTWQPCGRTKDGSCLEVTAPHCQDAKQEQRLNETASKKEACSRKCGCAARVLTPVLFLFLLRLPIPHTCPVLYLPIPHTYPQMCCTAALFGHLMIVRQIIATRTATV